MGELGIGTLCYNWHAVTGWARTHHDVPLRGDARSGGYDDTTRWRAAGRGSWALPAFDRVLATVPRWLGHTWIGIRVGPERRVACSRYWR